MSLVKSAQYLDGVALPVESLMLDDAFLDVDEDECMACDYPMDEAPSMELELDDSMLVDEKPVELVFELPTVPGGDNQDEIVFDEETEDEEVEISTDPWKWSVNSFLEWLQAMMHNVPRHSGRDTVGLERAIAYLEALDREISKAVRSDLNNEIAIDAVEKARDEIHKGIDRLRDRLDKVLSSKYPKRKNNKKKKAELSPDMIKEASKGAYYGAITVTIPILISGIARACINSMVSAGKDIEDEFKKLSTKYKLDNREEFMLYQTLSDMGYHVRRPRGTELDESIDTASTENTGWIQNFPG